MVTAAAAATQRELGYEDYANTTVSPIFDKCTDVFQSCAFSRCCKSPGFACMKNKLHPQAFMCRPRATPCADDAVWSCPKDDFCADPFMDCRAKLCCQTMPHFRGHKDVPFQCMRRPQLYYAMCRPPADLEKPTECKDGKDWMCPGWERCGGPHEECTHSRCCSAEGHSCYLNGSALEDGKGWHAVCLPKQNHTLLEDGKVGKSGVHWINIHDWFDHVHEVADHAEWYFEVIDVLKSKPLATMSFVLILLACCILVCCACVGHRQRMQIQLRKLENELAAAHAKAMRAAAANVEGAPKLWGGASSAEIDQAAEPGTALHRALSVMSRQKSSRSSMRRHV